MHAFTPASTLASTLGSPRASTPVARVASLIILLALACAAAVTGAEAPDAEGFNVLVFSKTAGFRHGSIPEGVSALRSLGGGEFTVEATEDAAWFTRDTLSKYRVIVFLNTTGDVLDDTQQAAFESFIRAGNGYVGVHAAADTEYDWPWYGRLVGAYFKSHPRIQPATVRVADRAHPATAHLLEEWSRTDEWYNYRANPRSAEGSAEHSAVRVLMTLDTGSYEGSAMMADHPIAWCHDYDGGRALYTGGGHTAESFRDPAFRAHLRGAILWAAGGKRE